MRLALGSTTRAWLRLSHSHLGVWEKANTGHGWTMQHISHRSTREQLSLLPSSRQRRWLRRCRCHFMSSPCAPYNAPCNTKDASCSRTQTQELTLAEPLIGEALIGPPCDSHDVRRWILSIIPTGVKRLGEIL
ncbi:Hypothetical predicted protein [Pelobates cultripes]|uniref:Uncharacterized protein n=1 Tax=Pelobates cultripes TaxID=61616 RepID=A0AAD1WKZ6_PELCU|nr:Hypothetical predicted protein [Pelobates cultripes]